MEALRIEARIAAAERGLELSPFEVRLGHRTIDGYFGAPYVDNSGVAQAPFDDAFVALGWKLPSPADIAKLRAEAARAAADSLDVEDHAADLATRVRILHARVLARREEEDLAQGAEAIARRLESQIRARVSAEAAADLDLHLAALERLDAAGDTEEVGNETRRLENELAGLVGLPVPLRLVRGRALCMVPDGSTDEIIARAVQASGSLRGLDARREEARITASLAWAAWLPSLENVLVGWYNEPFDRRDTTRLRLDFALPVLEPLSARTQVPALALRRLDALRAEAVRRLGAQVRSAVQRVEQAREVVRGYEESQTTIVERGLADVERAIDAGETDVLRLAEVQRRAVRSRRGLVRARLRCEEAAIELLRLTGGVVPSQTSSSPR